MLLAAESNPFNTENLIRLPQLKNDDSNIWSGFRFEAEPHSAQLSLAATQQPKLPSFHTDILTLETPDTLLTPIDSNSRSSIHTPDREDESESTGANNNLDTQGDADLWIIPDLSDPSREDKLISWDHFAGQEHEEPACALISEADSAIFDELLRKCFITSHDERLRYARPDVLVSALFDLGLGRDSSIFSWNKSGQRFEALTENYTTNGLHRQSLQHVAIQFLDAGAQFRRLRLFEQMQHRRSPVVVALQTSLRLIADNIERVVESARLRVCSIVRLQNVYHGPHLLLAAMDRLIQEGKSIRSDVDLIDKITLLADDIVLQQPHLRGVLQIVVSNTLQPWLQDVTAELGLIPYNQLSELKSYETMCALVPDATAQTFDQARKTLQLLQRYGHNCLSWQRCRSADNSLPLRFSSEAISELQQKACDYERELEALAVMVNRPKTVPRTLGLPGNAAGRHLEKGPAPFLLDTNLFGTPLAQGTASRVAAVSDNNLLEAVTAAALNFEADLSTDTMLFFRQSVDLSISPMVHAQHRLLSYSVLQLLFQADHFASHMELLGRFQLMGDGNFVSKMSMALFDSRETGREGRLQSHGRTGLRLPTRETWPPATSELRLALMGILAESMLTPRDHALTNSVSFAIKDLADEDLERCRDIDSIYALDFLRLNYKAPTMCIEAVITPRALDRYDEIFNQLLRLLRMKALAQSILWSGDTTVSRRISKPSEQKFRVEIQQFVVALGEYCQNVVIKAAWLGFESKLQMIQEQLDRKDYDGTLELASGLDELRELHDMAQDKIMRGLLLKRRQSEAKGVIDRIFEVILRFTAATSKQVTAMAHGVVEQVDHESVRSALTSRLHQDFEVHMKALVRWLRAECERGANDGNEMFEHLLLKLDWNGYWSR